MVSKLAREIRCTDVLRIFSKSNKGMSFFTFTTPDVVSISEIRERWRNLRHYLVEREGSMLYVMNYELHPNGHGWHIHAVFNKFINLRKGGIYKLRSYGFGLINCKKVDSLGVANYLSKHCLKAYRGVSKSLQGQSKRLRLVNCSRGLPCLADYKWRSAYCDRVRVVMQQENFKTAFKGFPFAQRYRFSEYAVLNGWSVLKLIQNLRNANNRLVSSSLLPDYKRLIADRRNGHTQP